MSKEASAGRLARFWLAVVIGLLVLPTIYGAAGALGGYMYALAWGDTLQLVLGKLGLHGVSAWQFGAVLGYFGGFFTRNIYSKE